ncbi:hypothetical protein ACTUHY_12220 [Acidaminococcus sp. LBK-2]|uniref:hypothetical protein n=1 Tax=Acidaminococcus TaxID=904 RepID=UPI00242D2DD5|nr:hypothetical protein [Acidaminococcus fermentans]
MMKPPEIYGEWIPLLERFAEGKDDREVLPAMQAGKLPCFRIVLERFTARLDAAMEKRFERLVGEFQAQGAMQTPDQAEQMIRGLRDGLGQLKSAVTLPCLPESLRNQFPAEIQKGADRVQASLEASAAQNHSGVLQHFLQLYPVNRWEERHEQS